ncbi:MAG TPA: metallophosphoesterase [Methanotrichaceae archaeon]|nr:metallophosphoesterase [Methanotrichaceae archaeon]HQF17530.1 metallophosphoesterase [Methanotrichaceae archaeon]HQI92127.1 metallophosphoesterase [Methanotrichaceae archaeon]
MIIGLMSDSHDCFWGLLQALSIFERREAEMVLHAGDIISPGMCYAFEGRGMDIRLVFGNNDGDRLGLMRDFQAVGCRILGDFGEVEADGRRIALLHGTDEAVVRSLAASGEYDVVVRGHTHLRSIVKAKALVINPGELWGPFSGTRSVALLDTDRLAVEVVELKGTASIKELLSARAKAFDADLSKENGSHSDQDLRRR